MTTNLDHMREVAEKAIPWATTGEGNMRDSEAYRLAVANPQSILALLDELAALRKENEGLREALKRSVSQMDMAADCLVRGLNDEALLHVSVTGRIRAAIGDSHE